MQGPSDAEVLRESIIAPERFERIFERHYPALRSYACRRIGIAGEDLAAEAFLIAFSVRSTFDTKAESARPWLFGIAHNLVLHHMRAERTRLAAWRRLPLAQDEPDHADPDRLDAILAREIIERALLVLPEIDREAFLLAALGELTYSEIASTLGIPIGTVRSKLFRVRRVLREQIDGELETVVTAEKPDQDETRKA